MPEKTMVTDIIGNYKTVQSLANQEYLVEKYIKHEHESFISSFKHSFMYAFSIFWIYNYSIPMIFYMASRFESSEFNNGRDYESYYISFVMVLQAGLVASIALVNAPNYEKGKEVAYKIMDIDNYFDEVENSHNLLDEPVDITAEEASGDIEFQNVWFKYPQTYKWILKNFNIKIKAGQSVGIVGRSGCGKSTLTQLLLRFYEPQYGEILIGGKPIN
jgi:ATP-binding cassette subfamily B (MDR/TAP) protein 1